MVYVIKPSTTEYMNSDKLTRTRIAFVYLYVHLSAWYLTLLWSGVWLLLANRRPNVSLYQGHGTFIIICRSQIKSSRFLEHSCKHPRVLCFY